MADNNNPIKYSDLVSPDDSITKLIAQLKQLSEEYLNALKNIKSEALTVRTALETVSGATESGRQTIRAATSDTDKLTKAEKELAFAESENAKKLAELRQAQREANEITKLTERLNRSAETSYNRLSAQYSLNKIYLNRMTVEEREATEDGRKLEAETKAIYEEMKRLQEATGKTSLNVGNYGAATERLTTIIRNNVQELANMRASGESGTLAYQQLLERTGELKDSLADATQEINAMASDTIQLDAALSAAAIAGGGMALFTGAVELFGAESEDVAESQKKLQAAISITTGLQALQNNLQKQSAIMLAISKVQTLALAKAEAYRRLIQIQGTNATIVATIAQKAFNSVAMMNPYILLAVALIAVVAALVIFSDNTKDAAEQQNRLNELQKAHLDYLDLESAKLKTLSNERISVLQRELKIAQARNASLNDIRKIEDDILQERRSSNAEQRGFYAQEIKDLEKNKATLDMFSKSLIKLNELKAQGDKNVTWDVELNGNIETYKVDDAINITQAKINNYGRMVEIGVSLKTEQLDVQTDADVQAGKRQKDAQDAYKTELDLLRKAEEAKNALIRDTYSQQRASAKAANARQITDLQYQLNHEQNLTAKGRVAINSTITSLRQQLANELVDIANKEAADLRTLQRQSDDIQLELMSEGSEKRRMLLKNIYDRQIEDIQIRLDSERGLSENQTAELLKQQIALRQQYANDLSKLNDQITVEQLQKDADRTQLQLDATKEGSQEEINLRIQLLRQQRQIELAQNRQLSGDVRQNEADINAKYDAEILKQAGELGNARALLIFEQQQALSESEFDLLRNSEGRKTRFALDAEKKRLQKILELNKTAGVKMTDEQVATIKNTIAKIDQETKKSAGDERGKDLYGLFGLNLDEEQKEAIDSSVSFAMEQLQTFLDAKVAAADAAVDASNKEVDASQNRVDSELEARANGYASNVVQAQKDLDLARKTQDKALKDQAKAQKQQQAIQTLQQIGNLVTASAMIWAQLGFPFAIPAIAVMWGSFAASKIKASQLSKQSQSGSESENYGDGTVEFLNGGSHQSGNDIDLGTKPDGTRRRAEGGEFFAVINKRNSRRFRRVIPDVINSLNSGTFAHKYLSAYDGANGLSISVHQDKPDISDLKEDVRAIREQNKRRTYIDAEGNTIIVYNNLTRKIKGK